MALKVKQKKHKKSNYLINEKSPYLLQHAYNPINWYPWGNKAFKKAKKENKPIFLSIGYSTCHWCHVMARESFEDSDVAKLLNDTFVCVKVDREERPDIDNLYMKVCQLMTGSGGWPLTIIMTPDKKPFFATTYIPKENRFGRIGMINLIPQIKILWQKKQEQINHTVNQVTIALEHISHTTGGQIKKTVLNTAYKQLLESFDKIHGGFGNAPKFPTPHNLLFLLRYWKRTNEKKALEMVEKTLHAMHNGAIFDHLGYGFHRYATDRQWLFPHFEKMLYDQALLALTYIETYQITKNNEYEKTGRNIFEYVLRDMTSPDGGHYSAEDADSEGEEGKFYIWSYDELKKALGKDTSLFMKVFNVPKDENFDEEASGKSSGKNILHLKEIPCVIAQDMGIAEQSLIQRIECMKKKLFKIRDKRVHPHKDDKILIDWNGLMIAALAKGGRVFDEAKFTRAAAKSARFILKKMQDKNGRLMHRFRDGEAAVTANLNDYAFFIWGLIELYETTFDDQYLSTALDFTRDMIKHFYDGKTHGFYFTPHDGEHLLIRQKDISDSSIPSGNSVALLNLLRLSRMTANPDYEKIALETTQAFATKFQRTPVAHTQLMTALDFMFGPSYEVVIVGSDLEEELTKSMLRPLREEFLPNTVVLFRPCDGQTAITRLAPYTQQQKCIGNKPTAYVCENAICKAPTNDINTMLKLLTQRGSTYPEI
jgi:uncharacterized protein YyaL (SSP411 family)